MRVIIRLSINNDYESGLRKSLVPILEGAGLVRDATTATFEGFLTEAELREAMRRFWNAAHSHTGEAHIDNFWMYADKKTEGGNEAQVDADEEAEAT
jgi:hypothetical protein